MASSQARAEVRADIGGGEFNSQTSVPQEEVGVNDSIFGAAALYSPSERLSSSTNDHCLSWTTMFVGERQCSFENDNVRLGTTICVCRQCVLVNAKVRWGTTIGVGERQSSLVNDKGRW